MDTRLKSSVVCNLGAALALVVVFGGGLGLGGCRFDTEGHAYEGDSVCGDGLVTGAEVCDGSNLAEQDCVTVGLVGGTLACAEDCDDFDTSDCTANCGDGVGEGNEVCDGTDMRGTTCEILGYLGGTLRCAGDCTAFDTMFCTAPTCGNATAEGFEPCDGEDLRGQSCESRGYLGGDLICLPDCSDFGYAGCVVAADCGNDELNGAEVCDGVALDGEDCVSQGFDSGILACQPSCNGFDTTGCGTCGNDVVDGEETCDGPDLNQETCVGLGFNSGSTLACNFECDDYLTGGCGTCPNGVIDGDEVCDGLNLGGETCSSQGSGGEGLECRPDCLGFITSNCSAETFTCGSLAGCFQPDLVNCLCAGCTPSGCQGGDDCICSGCTILPPCQNSCVDDGVCNPYSETCACADCAGHPLCP